MPIEETATIPLIIIKALAEVGYIEKRTNSQLEIKDANVGSNNYTKYGQWYGMNGQAWCDMFVSWCANEAGDLSATGKSAWVPGHRDMCKNMGIYFVRNPAVLPQPGDLIFFRSAAHIGMVEYVEKDYVHTIEGNTNNSAGVEANGGMVCRKTYSINEPKIDGYARPHYTNFVTYGDYLRALSSVGHTKLIFIGDSRTIMMKAVVERNSNIWSASASADITWMKRSGVPQIEANVTSGTFICFLTGFKDLLVPSSSHQYAEFINSCADRWVEKGASTYFVTINPVAENGYGGVNNKLIEEWNQKVRSELNNNAGYIDTYSAIFDSYQTIDGFNYDRNSLLKLYQEINDAVGASAVTMYSNPAVIAGRGPEIDYTKLNPYVVTLDRYTSDIVDYSKFQENQIVGAIVETGYLYDEAHNKVKQFEQPKLKSQLEALKSNNLNFGYYFIARASSVAEAQSEMYELYYILMRNSPTLGVWVKLELTSKSPRINDLIIEYYQKQLIRLGFAGKVGFYTTKTSLDTISWDKFQDNWFLWLIDPVEDVSELQQLLDPKFFDVDGVI